MVRGTLKYLLLGAAMLATGSHARLPAVDGIAVVYDFYFGGFRAGELTISANFGAENYDANAVLETTGIVEVFFDLAFEAEASGRVAANGLSPEIYVSKSRERKSEELVEISFLNGTPVSSRIEPVRKQRRWSINAQDQHGTIDPLSAVLASLTPAAASEVCEQRVEVFDGRRRFALEMGRRERDGKRIQCDAQYVRLAGFKPKWMGDNSTRPFTLYLEERKDGLFEVVRAIADTSFGAIVLRLRD